MPVRIGTAEAGGTFHTQGRVLAQALSGLMSDVTVLESAQASIENARNLGAGTLEFGFMAANWVGRAQRGEPPFEEAIDLRVAAPMNAGPIFFIVKEDSPLWGITELRGRRVAVGAEGSGMHQHAISILDAIGLGFSEIQPVFLDFAPGAEALEAGEVDAQIQCPLPNQVMTELNARCALRVLFYRTRELDRVLEQVPHYRGSLVTRSSIRGMGEDLPQVGVVNLLMTHGATDPATVFNLVRAVVARQAFLTGANPLFTTLPFLLESLRRDGPGALTFDGVPLHEAALRAYQSTGLLAAS